MLQLLNSASTSQPAQVHCLEAVFGLAPDRWAKISLAAACLQAGCISSNSTQLCIDYCNLQCLQCLYLSITVSEQATSTRYGSFCGTRIASLLKGSTAACGIANLRSLALLACCQACLCLCCCYKQQFTGNSSARFSANQGCLDGATRLNHTLTAIATAQAAGYPVQHIGILPWHQQYVDTCVCCPAVSMLYIVSSSLHNNEACMSLTDTQCWAAALPAEEAVQMCKGCSINNVLYCTRLAASILQVQTRSAAGSLTSSWSSIATLCRIPEGMPLHVCNTTTRLGSTSHP